MLEEYIVILILSKQTPIALLNLESSKFIFKIHSLSTPPSIVDTPLKPSIE